MRINELQNIYQNIRIQIRDFDNKKITIKQATENITLLLHESIKFLDDYFFEAFRNQIQLEDVSLLHCYKLATVFEIEKLFLNDEDRNTFINQVKGTFKAVEEGKMNIYNAFALLYIIHNNNTENIKEESKVKKYNN